MNLKKFLWTNENTIFGKTMENVIKYKEVKLVTELDGEYEAKIYIKKKFP